MTTMRGEARVAESDPGLVAIEVPIAEVPVSCLADERELRSWAFEVARRLGAWPAGTPVITFVDDEEHPAHARFVWQELPAGSRPRRHRR